MYLNIKKIQSVIMKGNNLYPHYEGIYYTYLPMHIYKEHATQEFCVSNTIKTTEAAQTPAQFVSSHKVENSLVKTDDSIMTKRQCMLIHSNYARLCYNSFCNKSYPRIKRIYGNNTAFEQNNIKLSENFTSYM